VVQIEQRRQRNPRGTDLHSRAGGRLQHPGRHDRDDARRRLDVHDLAISAPFAVLQPDATPMKRMPAIVNHTELPDMGRMTP
jgi:hypothetical protein